MKESHLYHLTHLVLFLFFRFVFVFCVVHCFSVLLLIANSQDLLTDLIVDKENVKSRS